MALVTAAQIKTQLETGTELDGMLSINAFVVQDVGRREYPSIDIENITGQERLRDIPTSKDKQIYLIHSYVRTVGFGEADEPDVKTFENAIFAKIDTFQDTITKITITESWKREHFTVPTPHIRSTLRVTTEEIFNEIGGGDVLGSAIFITFPAPLSTLFRVTNLITDRLEATKDLDFIMNTGGSENEEIYSLIHAHGLLDVEIVLPTSKEANLDTLIKNGDDITITLTKGNDNFVKTVNLISRTNTATNKEVQSTIVTMDVK